MAKKKAIKNRYFYLYWFLTILIGGAVTLSVALFIYISTLYSELPTFERLEKYEPSLISKVYSGDGVLLKEFFEENRNPVFYEDIPAHFIRALQSTEDREFFNHWGFNSLATFRAALFAIPRKLMGKSVRGASTITQQLARNLYNEIGFKKSVERKIKELLTAIILESIYSKQEIMEMYLTEVYFGNGAYGIVSAAKRYFGKKVKELNVEESALLVAQLKAPTYYNPYRRPKSALIRRNQVMRNMVDMGFISEKEYQSYAQIPILVKEKDNEKLGIAPYFTEYVRQQLNDVNKKYDVDYLRDGLIIETTLDSRIQEIADSVIARNLPVITKEVQARYKRDRKSGLYKYIQTHYDSTQWKQMMNDTTFVDSLMRTKLVPQIGFMAVNPKTGEILAMIGGTDFQKTKFNRAVQAWRQPGSIFKPINYLSALDNGYSPSTEILNQRVVLKMPNGKIWAPSNYNKDNTGGLTTLRWALTKSMNIISVRVIQELVTPKEVITYAKKLGMDTRHIPAVDAIALGAGEVRPLDIVTAYCAIANKGTLVKPYSIKKVKDKNRQLIVENRPKKQVAISEETAFLITDMMKDVVDFGTGRRIRWKYNFRRDVAGKTGTTNDQTDAWFCGFTPQIAAVIWVGLDDRAFKMGHGSAGSNVACPFWGDFISTVYKKLKWPEEKFEKPEGVVEIEICKESKHPVGPYCPRAEKEYFNRKYIPEGTCPIHKGYQRKKENNYGNSRF